MADRGWIGVLGAGQLGRMTVIAAAQMGLRTHVFAPDAKDSPAGELATRVTQAEYKDRRALERFASGVDAVTCEFENVPANAMETVSKFCLASPGKEALRVAQHRLAEKELATSLGIETPRYVAVNCVEDLAPAINKVGGRGILKTCRFGYDGKGQREVDEDSDILDAYDSMTSDDIILEEYVRFEGEVSVLLARDADARIRHFPLSWNNHKNGVLAHSVAPAPVAPALESRAMKAAETLADAIDLTGLLAVEFFITEGGRLLFNEMAPRPHNSFHWTIEGCATSQFTQLVRVVAGLGFGDTSTSGTWRMDNILGQDMADISTALEAPGAHLHLYGKNGAHTGRKMGHVTLRIDA